MKILNVGDCGYIGGYLTDHLVKQGHDVTIYDNLMYESRFSKKVKFINGDIRDFHILKDIVNEYDVVIWLAALVGDGACKINPALTELINYECTQWLADHFKGKIIFMSTCSVYGMNNEWIDENSPTNPLSKYAETKLAPEQYGADQGGGEEGIGDRQAAG